MDKENKAVDKAKIAILVDGKVVETDETNKKGEYEVVTPVNVGTDVTVKLTKENFKDTEEKVKIGDGEWGIFEKSIEFLQVKVKYSYLIENTNIPKSLFLSQFKLHFTALNVKDGKGLKDVEIKLGKEITLTTNGDGKAETKDFLDVNKEYDLSVSKEGYNGVDIPAKITVNGISADNKFKLKKEIKDVCLMFILSTVIIFFFNYN